MEAAHNRTVAGADVKNKMLSPFFMLSYTCLCFPEQGGFQRMKRRDFLAAVGAAVGLAIVNANAEIVPRRPRLLISRTDPFTGLALLKTRYASGMRPSDDMEG
jgi:hypothetical protein